MKKSNVTSFPKEKVSQENRVRTAHYAPGQQQVLDLRTRGKRKADQGGHFRRKDEENRATIQHSRQLVCPCYIINI